MNIGILGTGENNMKLMPLYISLIILFLGTLGNYYFINKPNEQKNLVVSLEDLASKTDKKIIAQLGQFCDKTITI